MYPAIEERYRDRGGPPGPDDCYVHAGPVTHTSGLFVLHRERQKTGKSV